MEQASWIVEVQNLALGRLDLRGKTRIADVHLAIRTDLAVPNDWNWPLVRRHLIESDERNDSYDERQH